MFETGFHGFYVDLFLHAAEDKLHRAVCGQLRERFRVPVRNERIIVPDVAHASRDRALELRDERQGGAVVEPREKLARLLVENAQRSLPRSVIRVTELTEIIQIEQCRVLARRCALDVARHGQIEQQARRMAERGGLLRRQGEMRTGRGADDEIRALDALHTPVIRHGGAALRHDGLAVAVGAERDRDRAAGLHERTRREPPHLAVSNHQCLFAL